MLLSERLVGLESNVHIILSIAHPLSNQGLRFCNKNMDVIMHLGVRIIKIQTYLLFVREELSLESGGRESHHPFLINVSIQVLQVLLMCHDVSPALYTPSKTDLPLHEYDSKP